MIPDIDINTYKKFLSNTSDLIVENRKYSNVRQMLSAMVQCAETSLTIISYKITPCIFGESWFIQELRDKRASLFPKYLGKDFNINIHSYDALRYAEMCRIPGLKLFIPTNKWGENMTILLMDNRAFNIQTETMGYAGANCPTTIAKVNDLIGKCSSTSPLTVVNYKL